MITVTKTMHTETGHRLIDYEGRCAHIHGHSYRWEVTATSTEPNNLDYRGMVLDFKDLKKAMMEVIDPYDHAFVMSTGDPIYKSCECDVSKLKELLIASNGQSPRLFVVNYNPTAENMALEVIEQLNEITPDHIIVTKIRLWETATSFAEVTNQ